MINLLKVDTLVGFLFTPVAVFILILLEYDPPVFIIRKPIIPPWSGNNFLYTLIETLYRFIIANLAAYELERLILYSIVLAIIQLMTLSSIIFSIMALLKTSTDRGINRIHISRYRVAQLLFGVGADLAQKIALVATTSLGLYIVLCNYAVVKMHSLILPVILVGFIVAEVTGLTVLQTVWDMAVLYPKLSGNLLTKFKNAFSFRGNIIEARKEQMKMLRSLRPIVVPVGVGGIKFVHVAIPTKVQMYEILLDLTFQAVLTF